MYASPISPEAQRMRLAPVSGKQSPAERFPGVKRDHAADFVWDGDLGALERHRVFVHRQIIKARAVLGREGFQPVERALLFEDLCITFERERRVEDSRAAAR